MIIETNPCENCDCSPAFCDGDIEICQMTKGDSSPISDDVYEKNQSYSYKRNYRDSIKAELYHKIDNSK